MNVEPWTLILTAGLLFGGASETVQGDAPEPERCQAMEGTIAVAVHGIRLSLRGLELVGKGTSNGDIEGPVKVTIRRKGSSDQATWVTVRLRIQTDAGALRLQGDAVAVNGKGRPNVKAVDGSLTFRSGTGSFHGAQGVLAATGSADTERRTLLADYSGELCRTQGEEPSSGRGP